jgi:hypothetical protein
MPTQSHEGFRYWCIFIDDHSRYWGLYFLRSKDQTFQAFKSYKTRMELETGYKIKALQDDKGGEFMPKAMEVYLEECGIQRRHTMRAEPHSNGIAERANGIIANRTTSLLHEAKLPPSFWSKAVATVCYTHNRMPTSPLPNSTPYEALYKTKPDVSLLRVFDSLAYVHVKKDKRKGLSQVLAPICKRLSLWAILLSIKGGSFTIQAPRSLCYLIGLTLMRGYVLALLDFFLTKCPFHFHLPPLLLPKHLLNFTIQIGLTRWEMSHLWWEMINHLWTIRIMTLTLTLTILLIHTLHPHHHFLLHLLLLNLH